jgi:hypothetical protein
MYFLKTIQGFEVIIKFSVYDTKNKIKTFLHISILHSFIHIKFKTWMTPARKYIH